MTRFSDFYGFLQFLAKYFWLDSLTHENEVSNLAIEVTNLAIEVTNLAIYEEIISGVN